MSSSAFPQDKGASCNLHEASQHLPSSIPTLLACRMSHLLPFPFDPAKESTKANLAKYVENLNDRGRPFSCCAYQLVTEHGLRSIAYVLHRSTPSMMIHFFTYSISIDRPSLTGTKMTNPVTQEGSHGPVNDGGTNLYTFANDGDTSFSGRHLTWAFASSVHMARELQACWHIPLPFLSSSITLAWAGRSQHKMNRG
jgi:hypothetical protein